MENMFLFSSLKDIQLHFATPILSRAWPDAEQHNPKLAALIRDNMHGDASVQISNEGGWQSRDDLLQWDHPSIQALANWFLNCAVDIHDIYHNGAFKEALKTARISFRCTGWANVNRRGDWNNLHNHANSHWSGVYYVQTPPDCGEIAFLDPRHGANMLSTGNGMLDLFAHDQWTIQPQAGQIVLFPSWLYHLVKSNRSDEERISIAVNIRFNGLTPTPGT